jgi:hypothetical protein
LLSVVATFTPAGGAMLAVAGVLANVLDALIYDRVWRCRHVVARRLDVCGPGG